MKELTKKQKKKADKVLKLIEELKSEGVNTVLVAGIGTTLYFGRKYDFDVDHNGFLELLNFGKFYRPEQEHNLLDCRGL